MYIWSSVNQYSWPSAQMYLVVLLGLWNVLFALQAGHKSLCTRARMEVIYTRYWGRSSLS